MIVQGSTTKIFGSEVRICKKLSSIFENIKSSKG